MKRLLVLIFLLLFVASINAQTKTLEAIKKENDSFGRKTKCEISYDKFKDITVVSSKPSYPSFGLGVQAAFYFKGQTLNAPVKDYSFYIYTNDLMRSTSLIFISNNERVQIGEAVDSNFSTYDFIGTKVYRHKYEFSLEQFEKFASSAGTEFQISNIEGKTSKETFEKLNNLKALSIIK